MHSTRAQDTAEPRIADFGEVPADARTPRTTKDDGLLISEIAHFATIPIVTQPQY
jgi:hypothetical protein